MKTGTIKINEVDYGYSFSMVAVEKALTELFDGDIMAYINYLEAVKNEDPKEMGIKLSRTLRIICVKGMENYARTNKQVVPFDSEEELGLHIESVDQMVPCFEDFNNSFFDFFLKGAEKPTTKESKKAPKTKE